MDKLSHQVTHRYKNKKGASVTERGSTCPQHSLCGCFDGAKYTLVDADYPCRRECGDADFRTLIHVFAWLSANRDASASFPTAGISWGIQLPRSLKSFPEPIHRTGYQEHIGAIRLRAGWSILGAPFTGSNLNHAVE